MTIKEAREKYGWGEEGYIFCGGCPLPKESGCGCCVEACEESNGFEWCWQHIAEYMTAKESDPGNSEKSAVNHPSHYNQGDIECIDAMKAAFGADELAVYCKIAAFKYVWRCEHKNGLEDVKKAVWYLNKYLELKGVGTDADTVPAGAETS